MVTVAIALDGTEVPSPALRLEALPRRVSLSRSALELLASIAEVSLPWQRPSPAADLAAALGGKPPAEVGGAEELRAAGLVDADELPPPEVRRALAVFAKPEIAVDLDLVVRRGGGVAQLHAWHRMAADQVVALTTTGGRVELAWFSTDWWQAELGTLTGHAETVEGDGGAGVGPLPGLEVPLDLMLATGRAAREHRHEVLAELRCRAVGQVRDGAGRVLDLADTSAQLDLMHGATRARLQALVVSPTSRRVGAVSWVLFPDGWRRLVPVGGDRQARVRLVSAGPAELGAEVARLAVAVRP